MYIFCRWHVQNLYVAMKLDSGKIGSHILAMEHHSNRSLSIEATKEKGQVVSLAFKKLWVSAQRKNHVRVEVYPTYMS